MTSSKLIDVSLMSLLIHENFVVPWTHFGGNETCMGAISVDRDSFVPIQYLLISVHETFFEFPHSLASVSVENLDMVALSEVGGVPDPVLFWFFCQT